MIKSEAWSGERVDVMSMCRLTGLEGSRAVDNSEAVHAPK